MTGTTAKILSQIKSTSEIEFEVLSRPKDAAGGLSEYMLSRQQK